MKSATFGRKRKKKFVQNARGLSFAFTVTPYPKLLCNATTKDSVFQKNERSCSSLLLVWTGALNKGEGTRPCDFEWSKEMEWDPSTTLYFTQRQWGVPRVWIMKDWNGQDTSAHIKALHLTAQCNSLLGDNPVLAGQRPKPEPVFPCRVWMEGQLCWPIGPNITLEQCDS